MLKKLTKFGPKPAVLALIGALLLCGSPLTAYASNTDVTVPSSGTADQNVTATFTIDNDTLIDLGYGAVVSVPLTIPLSYKSTTKTFEGEGEIYCSGLLAEGKVVEVTIDPTDEKYGFVSDSEGTSYNVRSSLDFGVSLDKFRWTPAEMQENLTNIQAGNYSDIIGGELFVAIPGLGFVPKVTGNFESIVPLVIQQINAV